MYNVVYLPTAQQDLVEIVTYITRELGNSQAAKRLATELVAVSDSLKNMPYRRRVYVPLRPLAHEYRALRVENYLMFYWVDESAQSVTIARVIYAKSDVLHRLESIL